MHYWNDPLKIVCVNHTWFGSNIMWVSRYVPQGKKKIWKQSLKYYDADNELKGIMRVHIIVFI